MKTKLIEQIQDEFKNLQDELGNFKSNIEYLNSAKDNVENAVDTVKLAENIYIQKMQELVNTYKEISGFNEKLINFTSTLEREDLETRFKGITSNLGKILHYHKTTDSEIINNLNQIIEHNENADIRNNFKNLEEQLSFKIESTKQLHLDLSKKIELLSEYLNNIDFSKKHEELKKDIFELIKQNSNILHLIDNKAVSLQNIINDLEIEKKFHNLLKSVELVLELNKSIKSTIENLEIPQKIKESEKNVLDFIKYSSEENNKYTKKQTDEVIQKISALKINERFESIDNALADIFTKNNELIELIKKANKQIEQSEEKVTVSITELKQSTDDKFIGLNSNIKSNFDNIKSRNIITWILQAIIIGLIVAIWVK